MKTLELTQKYAVVEFSKAVLENYNPSIVFESDNIEECESFDSETNAVTGYTIVEKREDGVFDYYSGEVFEMNTYK